jgi:hypothetical protein
MKLPEKTDYFGQQATDRGRNASPALKIVFSFLAIFSRVFLFFAL